MSNSNDQHIILNTLVQNWKEVKEENLQRWRVKSSSHLPRFFLLGKRRFLSRWRQGTIHNMIFFSCYLLMSAKNSNFPQMCQFRTWKPKLSVMMIQNTKTFLRWKHKNKSYQSGMISKSCILSCIAFLAFLCFATRYRQISSARPDVTKYFYNIINKTESINIRPRLRLSISCLMASNEPSNAKR